MWARLGAKDGQPWEVARFQKGVAEAQMFYVRELVQARVMARSCCHFSDEEVTGIGLGAGKRSWARACKENDDEIVGR